MPCMTHEEAMSAKLAPVLARAARSQRTAKREIGGGICARGTGMHADRGFNGVLRPDGAVHALRTGTDRKLEH